MRHRQIATSLVVALLSAGCTSGDRLPGSVEGAVDETTTTVGPAQPECPADEVGLDPTPSYDPFDPLRGVADFDSQSAVGKVRDNGKLRVGVSGDTLLFGSRNPQSGRIEGFDIDVLQEVAAALFGVSSSAAYDLLEIHVITYAQRLPALESRDVDIVAHTMTINCRRWQRIAFSSEYYAAGQRVLVEKIGDTPQYASLAEFAAADAKVCVPNGSTNQEFITAYGKGIVYTPPTAAVPDDPDDEVVAPQDISDCLVLLQSGEVDAITGDDTVLAGLKAQDGSTEIIPDATVEPYTHEPYGLGFNKDDSDLVKFVNGVLAEMRADGRWAALYQKWLIDEAGLQPPIPDPPSAKHGRLES